MRKPKVKRIISTQGRPGGKSVSRARYLPAAVRTLDLGCIRFKILQPESRVRWTASQAKLVESEYRKFLALRLLHPGKAIVPAAMLDVFWHQHILDTEKYAHDCNKLFGEFMHHFPYFGLRSAKDAKNLADAFIETCDLYRAAFGPPPRGMWTTAADCGRLGCAPSCKVPANKSRYASSSVAQARPRP